jgi:hypothetical protein
VDTTRFFASSKNVFVRTIFACIGFTAFILTGASCYAFPLLLTQILPGSVHISESQTSFLGGLIYISLGVSGATILVGKKADLLPLTEFITWTVTASVCTVLPWVLFHWLVTTPESSGGHNVAVVALALVMQGFAAGIFSNVWGMHLIMLYKPKYISFALVAINMSLPLGAVLFLLAKYDLGVEEWVLLQLIVQGSFFALLLIFSVAYCRDILDYPEQGSAVNGPAPPSTMAMVADLLFGKSKERLLEDAVGASRSALGVVDITSFQFYLVGITYFLFNSVGSAFMANIGPLTAHEDDSSAGEKEQLGIFVAAMVGQLLGRAVMPFIYAVVEKLCAPKRPSEMNDDVIWEGYSQRVVTTWRNLGISIAVCVLFIVCLILLQVIPSFPYIYAFTIISMGYGMMWVITSNYPTFFHPSHYSVLGSLFMCGGSITTIVLVSLISGLKMSKDGIFATLMIGSVGATMTGLIALIDMVMKQRAFLHNN